MSFCPISSDISTGLTLLEASAGTGKTYSLVRIIARHVVEKQIPLQQILTVTFTRAATAEIKERLHQLLHEALIELKQKESGFALDLAEKWSAQGPEFKAKAINLLSVALAHFDTVPIFTIDGFFQRILKEYAFESNSLFSVELETDEASIVDQALRDYWRSHVYNLDHQAFLLFSQYINFSSTASFINEVLRSPDATLSPAYSLSSTELTTELEKRESSFREFLSTHKKDILNFIKKPPTGISKRPGLYKLAGAENFEQSLHHFLENNGPCDTSIFKYLSSDYLYSDKATTKTSKAPLSEHPMAPVFEAISEFLNAPPLDLESAHLGEILHFVRDQLTFIKKERNIQTYTDITVKLANLLSSESVSAQSMIRSIRSTYLATLIDEFQDTSPQQSSVFLSLFHYPEGYLHIIGDPKQSIYRFRGADVYAYINARKNSNTIERLETNHRSSPSMIHAVNQLFSYADDPFLVDKEIEFRPSTWPHPEDTPSHSSLYFHHLDPSLKNVANFSSAIAANICSEILKLLDRNWKEIHPTEETRTDLVRPDDIAILVNSKNEGQQLFEHLNGYEIPAVIQTQTSLLNTDEAATILNTLHAVINFNKPAYIRTALLSPAFGDGELLNNEQEFIATTEHFSNAYNTWLQQGLMPMIRSLFEAFQVHPRLLALSQGIRSLTNLMHLAEILDNKSRNEGLCPTDITLWLDSAIHGNIIDTDTEVLELRLDSDQPSVHILTQHSSKGLEFPIVFVTPPCKRSFSHLIKPDLSYHDQVSHQLIIAAQSEQDDSILAQRKREACADRARLAYVSLTRAKYLCHFYYLPEDPKKPEENAVYQMLGGPNIEDLYHLSYQSNNCIKIDKIVSDQWPDNSYSSPEKEHVTELRSRDKGSTQWCSRLRTTSFSGLTHFNHSEESYRDIDRSSNSENQLEELGFWKDLQAGAGLGSAFHEILEEIDFQNLAGMEDVIELKLTNYQPFKKHFQKAKTTHLIKQVSHYIEQLVSHPLESDPSSVTLSQIADHKRIIEPQFVLTDSSYSLSQLADVLRSNPPSGLPAGYIDKLEDIDTGEFEGFLTGFIDLIFEYEGRYHILDWKTNRLKNPVTQYSNIALCEAMADHHYYLQYHLYTLALDSFLKLRLGADYDPKKHLGKAYYVFLRGTDPSIPGSGVFSDQLDIERLHQLRSTYQSV